MSKNLKTLQTLFATAKIRGQRVISIGVAPNVVWVIRIAFNAGLPKLFDRRGRI